MSNQPETEFSLTLVCKKCNKKTMKKKKAKEYGMDIYECTEPGCDYKVGALGIS